MAYHVTWWRANVTSHAESPQPEMTKDQLFSVLVMVGASRRELHELHSSQLPALGLDLELALDPLREAEACVGKVEQFLRVVAKMHFPDLQVPWETNEQTENSA